MWNTTASAHITPPQVKIQKSIVLKRNRTGCMQSYRNDLCYTCNFGWGLEAQRDEYWLRTSPPPAAVLMTRATADLCLDSAGQAYWTYCGLLYASSCSSTMHHADRQKCVLISGFGGYFHHVQSTSASLALAVPPLGSHLRGYAPYFYGSILLRSI
jgi:hypothetical protein